MIPTVVPSPSGDLHAARHHGGRVGRPRGRVGQRRLHAATRHLARAQPRSQRKLTRPRKSPRPAAQTRPAIRAGVATTAPRSQLVAHLGGGYPEHAPHPQRDEDRPESVQIPRDQAARAHRRDGAAAHAQVAPQQYFVRARWRHTSQHLVKLPGSKTMAVQPQRLAHHVTRSAAGATTARSRSVRRGHARLPLLDIEGKTNEATEVLQSLSTPFAGPDGAVVRPAPSLFNPDVIRRDPTSDDQPPRGTAPSIPSASHDAYAPTHINWRAQ